MKFGRRKPAFLVYINSMTIEAQNITVKYDDKPILENETVKIQRGKINVIIGKNGCGKSTLMKTLCKQLKVTDGFVTLNGIDENEIPIKTFAKKVGILFQENQIPKEIKVRDLVSYGRFAQIGLFSKMTDEDDDIIDEAMMLTNTLIFEDREICELSSGQRQLVWIAMLLAQEAEYLFLDEPTTFLDLKNQFDILNCLKKINKEKGKTLVLILHDINIAAQYADYIFAMKDGMIIKEGETKEVLTEEFLKELYDVPIEVINENDRIYCLPKNL